ncbi:MAG: amino acid permease [Oscillospiraceae bacterium]|nr:amino acid permease [Oscillospiraceae bacterium]
MENHANPDRSARYLSPLGAWALSFGCAVGWGAFVMPGTTFLGAAGPLGTALGIAIGALVMLIIGVNYHYLMNKFPDGGGTLTYSIRTFGYDHGFLSAWFLMLVYIAIIWANATALALIGRNLLGGLFRFGFHYQLLGYDIYFGEVLVSMAAIVIFGYVCIRGRHLAIWVQIALALVLLAGIAVCAVAVLGRGGTMDAVMTPAFAPDRGGHLRQIAGIVALTPWAFVGFESVSNSASGFQFSPKKIIWIMAAALLTSAAAYILLTFMAAAVQPEGCGGWADYIAGLGSRTGLEALPTFYATESVMGRMGLVALVVTTAAAIITGLVGNYIAASRLLCAMAGDGILPKWFGELNEDHNPRNAMVFLIAISLFVPFVGRTAIGWIVDVNTIGATIAYGYTSAAAFVNAWKDGRRSVQAAGAVGLAMSLVFFFYFMASSAQMMATESYLILAGWSILGFVFSRFVFTRDEARRFGKSTIVWIGLLFLIFFTTLMWVKQATQDATREVLHNLSEYNVAELAEHGIEMDEIERDDTEDYIEKQMALVNDTLSKNSMIQMAIIVLALIIMIGIYDSMRKREKEQEVRRALAEESSKAKTTFLSNMSHDIRTPMNAIIGYTNLAERDDNSLEQVREYLAEIKASSRHLLALINDVLEMSRIESGRMELEPVEMDLRETLNEARDMFAPQMAEKQIEFYVDASQVKNRHVLCDKNRFNRVLLNLLSNAYKFTPQGGSISVTLWQIGDEQDGRGRYELRVKDSGIGMSPEFAARVFEAFERERTSTVSGIQGTGLGMAITKSIVDMMGGTIEVITAPGAGTEFVIQLELQSGVGTEQEDEDEVLTELDFDSMRLLLVEDNEINREIALEILGEVGFTLETAVNGKEAVEKVAASAPGYYNAVLMDIQMPVMNGYEAARAIRALDDAALASIPIVAMTANAFSEDIKSAKDAGMNAHVAKPIDVEKLMKTLSHILK